MIQAFSLLSRDFLLVCAATFLYFGSFYLLMPTLPQYVVRLGGSLSQIGVVMGTFTFAAVLVRPYLGRVADRRGRKILMLIGAGGFSVLFSLYSFVGDVSPLYGLRVVHGLAHACFLAASSSYIADLAPADRRGEVLGIYGTSNVVAMALFPAAGTAIIARTGSFELLFAVSMVSAGAACLAVFFLRDISAAGQGTGQLSLLAVAKRRSVVVPSIALFTGATVYGATVTFLPVYAPQQGITNFGAFFTVYAAGTLLSRILVGKLSDRIGRRKVLIPFMALLTAAAFMLVALNSFSLLLTISVCFGLGFGALMPTLNAMVVDGVLPRERGSALGFFTSFMDLGITAGAMGLGLVGEHLGYSVMFGLAGMIAFAGLVLFILFGKSAVSPINES